MKRQATWARWAWLLAALCLGHAETTRAQTITGGSINGVVEDQQGGRLPGVTVVALHVETGTTYQAVTQAEGRFSLLAVRVGTYRVHAELSGFKPAEQGDVRVGLGEDRAVKFALQVTLAETVSVTASASPIDASRAGTGGGISEQVKTPYPQSRAA